MTLQPFKENDTMEARVVAASLPALVPLGTVRDTFYENAFLAAPLGEVLYDLERDPMAGVVTRAVFRASFFAIHQLFTRPGTFEFYLELFRAIWGEDVDAQFTVPGPGKLEIGISEIDISSFNLMAREIVDDAYVYSHLTDTDGNGLLAQDTLGTKTQSEVDALIRELSPAGVFTTATLEL